ncbi:bifunctional 2-C-methyl-D-erythritol 4-phosphate cytidylyltransferase/2-C-methyl-D-erythritol 2,4-cyclodiphosphate synthase [Euryhalocaulis caribicus]|uniref:bifunctional 2-C-methyl-D-erythritol 4-phosphate cytidylyltransferase/2-C-methyl-D-erythritol 2,4-cyclodiphosphate synthase n=1 Tax=Euryhalocaulis caribicus TaxID=1161401 RepID=UPI0003A76BF8|nr:bifunctional 2-C-methyl-D-erythritol 4-phosphate cytidylyltransferase/2-C-methyl-D-erythritol 2,4-cyclodiphosphate synthase [Euryhalocaulis caribicus]
MSAAAIIVAAGQGARFGDPTPKQFLPLAGKPVLRWSLELFGLTRPCARIVVVCDPDRAREIETMAAGLKTPVETVPGGETRTASVRAGLETMRGNPPDMVFIHDAARPLASPRLIDDLSAALDEASAAAAALPVRDALKRKAEGLLGEEMDRESLMAMQTPQAFAYQAIMDAYDALPPDAVLSDDVAVAQRAGMEVRAVPGDRMNFKITDPQDLAMMESLMNAKPAMRVATGHGFDVHQLIEGDGVTLCGVHIDCDKRLKGHSDADAGLHAICDAMLGTIGAGDIGQHFPPSDEAWRDADSAAFVTHCLSLMREAGARPSHCDVTLICEAPKVGPHRTAMQARVAELLGLPLSSVNIKATTTEKLGFIGRGEGVAAEAIVTAEVQRRDV